ncbi:MAG: hydroxysqualene dehydroxylase HpnE [Thiohalobacteraceae bacterium]|nr:hydroxysqualene dehydroxylase HpnE [Gammaproteobacteria bacterium]
MAEAPTTPPPVLVIGGGWAGLAAAVTLADAGRPVTLIEGARQLGGRARCVRFGERRVDNGQHIMVGAYRALLGLLDTLGVSPTEAFLRLPLDLHLRSLRRADLRLRARRLPAPLHLAVAVLTARGLPPASRLRLARFAVRLLRRRIELGSDISAQALLLSEGQDARLIQALWNPLCLATMNTPLNEASALLFLEVLQRTFGGDAHQGDLLIPRTDLGALLPEPAMEFIERRGGSVVLSRRIRALELDGDRLAGIRWQDGTCQTTQAILAVNPTMCRRLLMPHPPLAAIAAHIGELRHEPITTVYLRYPESVRIDAALQGLLDGLGQWLVDRQFSGLPGTVAVVISGRGEHLSLAADVLAARVGAELAALYPDWPAAVDHLVVREKRATFAATPGVDHVRPAQQTPVAGLWLAGDFTATGLPATLEGAVLSGRRAAAGILSEG